MVKRIGIFFITVVISLWIFSPLVSAAEFDIAYLRLNNQAALQSIDATICATPSSPGGDTENTVTIIFPNTFTISTNTSNWLANTTNLPTGATAWPGIAVASILGKSVTFTSSDLNLNTLYCFNISSSLSNTGSGATDKTGVISTKNNLNEIIDLTTYAVSVLNNQIQVTAKVNPQVSDLPISITSSSTGTNFPQQTILNYTISYGLNTLAPFPLTIQAEWSEGTIQGDLSPSVDILNYVVGSATTAYSGVSPVINTVNRTITWTIPNIPGQTVNQTVSFSLKTNANYTGPQIVNFDVSARASSSTTITPDETVSQSYLFVSPPAVVTLPGDGLSDGKSDGRSDKRQSPSQPLFADNLFFEDIYIRSISKSQAQIAIATSKQARLAIRYGNTPKTLNSTIKTLILNKQAIVNLFDLTPSTDYFFTITATDTNGKSITSDIFTFKTAVISPIPSINLRSLLVTSSDNVLLNPSASINNKEQNIIVIPRFTDFSIQFALEKTVDLKKIQAIVKNANVLGFNTTTNRPTAGTNFVDLIEVRPGIYTGKISSAEPGNYELYVRLLDFSGNILEEKVSDLNVTHKLRTFVKETNNQPVENVRLLLYLYNPTTKIYEVISPNILPIKNPSYSNSDGTYDLVLPYGQYKADISSLGFKPQTLFFQIEPYKGGYPTIYLEQESFNIINSIKYFWDASLDAVTASQSYLRQHADSSRLFNLLAFGVILLFIILSTLSISARTHVTLPYLPIFLFYKIILIFKKTNPRMVFGKVVEEDTNLPISKVIVYLKTANGSETVAKLKTNKLGEFYYRNAKGNDYQITISKKGFVLESPFNFKNSVVTQIPAILTVKREEQLHHSFFEILWVYTEDIFGLMMESLLFIGFILQIYFIFTFGLIKIAPFMALTIFNLILVFTYLYKPKGLEE